jgi:hypothetical protein
MRRVSKFCAILTALCTTVGFAASARAGVTVLKPTINLGHNFVAGNCNFRIGKDDPYVAINGPCVMERNNMPIGSAPTRVASHRRRGQTT